MPKTVDYYFSLVSPWAYLGFQNFLKVAEETGAKVNYKPVDMPKLFAETGGLPLAKRHPSRQAYRLQELARWKKALKRDFIFQPKHLPLDDFLAKRAVIAALLADSAKVPALIEALHRALWVDDLNLGSVDVLARVISDCGLDSDAILKAAGKEDAGETLIANTDEAIARGVFGVPTYAVGDALFWGQDRLDFLKAAILEP